MRARKNPHTPAASAKAYDCGGTSITLMPGDPLEVDRIGSRVNRFCSDQRDAGGDIGDDIEMPGLLHKAILLGLVWDDSTFELETPVPEVLPTDDSVLVQLGIDILRELRTREVRRMLQPLLLIERGLSAHFLGLGRRD